VLGNYFAQLIAPWGLFLPQPFSAIAAIIIIITQGWLFISGNFAWLGFLTIVLATTGFSSTQLKALIPFKDSPALVSSQAHIGMVITVTALVLYLSIWPVRNMLSRNQLMNASSNPYHLVNTYGAFGTVTKKRYEIIIEGTDEATVTADTKWKPYEFKAKPGDPARRPPQYAPYHLRLDWLMWFAAFDPSYNRYNHPWFGRLIEKLLQNDAPTLKLIRYNPFPDNPPRFIRARTYLYRYTTPAERKETGDWWHRELAGEYLPASSLR